MANVDVQKFLEDRLLALHPEEDVSAGSPAQVKFIQPVLDYLGTDPFETDIEAFISDRFSQEFPDLYASNPGAIRDIFVNPLRLLLEPWKRETQLIKRNQSLIDPSVLSDDDADALVANKFVTRDEGGYATGTVRIYYTNPIDQQIEITNRVYSKTDLNFYPVSLVTITAEQMVFNREGSLFYFDVPVQAEKQGSEYNIDVDEIAGIDGLVAAIRITNLQRFTGGVPRQTTDQLIAATEVSQNEQSLVTAPGASSRLLKTFSGSIQSVQLIGARDEEMQRDVLVGTSPGHAWITGQVDLYENVAYVRARTIDGTDADAPKAGDELYFYLSQSSVTQALRFVRVRVEELLFGPLRLSAAGMQAAYFVRWSDPSGALALRFPDVSSFYATLPRSFEGGFSKKGQLKITALPGNQAVDLSVESGTVHVYGHTDIYVRPTVTESATAVLSNATDLGVAGASSLSPHFSIERTALVTTAASNAVSDTGFDFVDAGVRAGDLLTIESGADAGIYTIGKVTASTLYLTQQLKANSPTVLHYRITRSLRTELFEPKVLHFPFGDVTQSILDTVIGSTLVRITDTSSVDLIAFGASVGDTLRILSGPDAGDYAITSFDANLGGKGIVLDTAMTSTNGMLPFEVFTPMEAVEKPLLRVKEISLLDSAHQSTGVTVPAALPLAVVPVGRMSSAQVLASSLTPSGFVLPDLDGLITGLANEASTPAGRYSSGIDPAEGVYVSLELEDAAQIEFDLLAKIVSSVTTGRSAGKCSFFLMTPESTDDAVNRPPAEPKVGESFYIKRGPNRGGYLVKDVIKLKYNTVVSGVTHENWMYFVQIYGTFPVDPLKRLIEFFQEVGQPYGLEPGSLTFPLAFPSFFNDRSTGWYYTLGSRLNSALTAAGVTSPPAAAEIQTVIESMTACSYEYGTPARGVLRTYFREPTVFEQWTGDAEVVTTYSLTAASGEVLKYRPEPSRYSTHQLRPARTTADTAATSYPRDLVVSGGGQNVAFTDLSRLTIFAAGVKDGDKLAVHEEILAYASRPLTQTLVRTFSGSSQITAVQSAGSVFTPSMVGALVFLDEGSDVGGYRVVRYVDSSSVVLDRPLQTSTPAIVSYGTGASYSYTSSTNRIAAAAAGAFSSADVGRYITVFDVDYRWMGSFEILTLVNTQTVTVQVPGATNFPGTPVTSVRWAITEAPDQAPSAVTRDEALTAQTGTETVAGVPIRIYEASAREFTFATVTSDASNSTATVTPYDAGTPAFNLETGIKQPYRITRSNVRRVTSTEMDGSRDGAFCYFDTEAVSLSPSSAANIDVGAYLTPDEGTFDSIGYRHVVADKTLTYSMEEDGYLDLPTKVLPVGADDAPDSFMRVLGTPVQITYETASILPLVQDFVDSEDGRTSSANMLVRNFLPVYVSYDASYSGGSSTDVVATDIAQYVNTIPAATALDVSEIQNIVSQRGGNLDTPTTISGTIHDWERRVWAEFSQDKLGGPLATDTAVPYSGTPRVTYFIAGPDVSGQETVAPGERINLVRS